MVWAQLVNLFLVVGLALVILVAVAVAAFVTYFVHGMIDSHRRGEWRLLPAKRPRGRHRTS